MQVAGECLPYSKTGGLADMVGALAKSLAGQGHRITVVTPLYKACQLDLAETTLMDWDLEIWMGGELIKGRVRHLEVHSNLHVLFIEQPEFLDARVFMERVGLTIRTMPIATHSFARPVRTWRVIGPNHPS